MKRLSLAIFFACFTLALAAQDGIKILFSLTETHYSL